MKWCLQARKSQLGVSVVWVGGWAAGGRGLAHTRDHLKIIENYYSVATSSHSAQLPRGLGAVDSSHLALGSKARSRGGKFE